MSQNRIGSWLSGSARWGSLVSVWEDVVNWCFPAISEKFHYILTIVLFPAVKQQIFIHFWRQCGKICNSFSFFGSFSGFVGFWIIYALSAWTFMIFWLYLFINNWKILVFIMHSYLQPVLQQFIYAIIVYVKWYLSK